MVWLGLLDDCLEPQNYILAVSCIQRVSMWDVTRMSVPAVDVVMTICAGAALSGDGSTVCDRQRLHQWTGAATQAQPQSRLE
jgi:hypothetical protein